MDKTINNEDQIHADIAAGEVTAKQLDLDGKESTIRRSMRQNKSIPVKQLRT